MPHQSVSQKLVNEAAHFCASALRRKAEEIEQAAKGAESPAAALAAISQCLLADSLMVLAQDPLRMAAEGSHTHPDDIADALGGFGGEADALRALLGEHEATAAE